MSKTNAPDVLKLVSASRKFMNVGRHAALLDERHMVELRTASHEEHIQTRVSSTQRQEASTIIPVSMQARRKAADDVRNVVDAGCQTRLVAAYSRTAMDVRNADGPSRHKRAESFKLRRLCTGADAASVQPAPRPSSQCSPLRHNRARSIAVGNDRNVVGIKNDLRNDGSQQLEPRSEHVQGHFRIPSVASTNVRNSPRLNLENGGGSDAYGSRRGTTPVRSPSDDDVDQKLLLELARRQRIVNELQEALCSAQNDLEDCRRQLQGRGSPLRPAASGYLNRSSRPDDPLTRLATEGMNAFNAIYKDIRSAAIGGDAAP